MTRLLGCTWRATPWYTAPMAKHKKTGAPLPAPRDDRGPAYEEILCAISALLEAARHGRGFSARNLRQMRAFYLGWKIWQTPSAKSLARAKGFTPAIDLADKGRPSVAATLIPKPTLATLLPTSS